MTDHLSDAGKKVAAVLAGESNGCIINGDCLEVMAAMPDNAVDAVVTDPPYGHNNNNGDLIHRWEAALGHGESGEARAIANDGREANEIVRTSFGEWSRMLKPGCCCCCCCCGGGGPDPQFARWSLWLDEVLDFKQMVVWDKGPMGMGWHYRRSYETVLVAQKPGAGCHWFGDKRVENIIRPGDFGIRKIIPSANQHPTQKPVELAARFIELHTEPGDLVLDPFCGSGTTYVAAKKLGRRYIGIELDPEYCEIARARVAATTPPLFGGM
jgi:DNA modification methylase